MLAALLLGFSAAFVPQGNEADPPVGLTVVIVDVGQGDGIVVRAPDGKVHVIDAGINGEGTAAVLPAIAALAPVSYGFTFLSHFHDDHQGGLDEVLNALPFVFAYDRGNVNRPNNTGVNNYLAAAGGRRQTITVGTVYQLGGGATATCIAANGNIVGGGFVDPTPLDQEENARSIALRLDYGQFSMWLGGDLTGGGNGTPDVEDPATLACGDVDVYKLNHHGSNTSTSLNLVAQLDPELAVVSCGTDNPYGHPTSTIVSRLNQAAAMRLLLSTSVGDTSPTPVIGFGVAGSIRIDTNGRRYRATAENGDFLDFYCDEVVQPNLTAGSVRISELMRDPNVVPDTNGEYIEVVNIGSRPVSLRGLQLADNSSTVTIASNFALLPGRPLVFAIDGAPSRNGGLPMVAPLPFGTLALSNTGDSVTLTQNAVAIDSMTYTSGFPGGAGVSTERRDLFGTHAAANYAPAAVGAIYGAGDRGSPGRLNDADITAHPVQIDMTLEPNVCKLHATALGDLGNFSVICLSWGTTPGFPFLNAHIPLNLDTLFQVALGAPGSLDLFLDEGYRTWSIPIAPPNPLAGPPIYASHVLLDFAIASIPGVSPAMSFVLP